MDDFYRDNFFSAPEGGGGHDQGREYIQLLMTQVRGGKAQAGNGLDGHK